MLLQLQNVRLQVDRADDLAIEANSSEYNHAAERNQPLRVRFWRRRIKVRVGADGGVFRKHVSLARINAGFDDVRLRPEGAQSIVGGIYVLEFQGSGCVRSDHIGENAQLVIERI